MEISLSDCITAFIAKIIRVAVGAESIRAMSKDKLCDSLGLMKATPKRLEV